MSCISPAFTVFSAAPRFISTHQGIRQRRGDNENVNTVVIYVYICQKMACAQEVMRLMGQKLF